METKKIKRLGIMLGLMAGGLVIAYFFVLYFSGAMLFDPFYKFDFWVTIPFIIVGIVYVRMYQKSLRAWQGLILGFYTTILCAGLISLFYYVFLTFIETDFIKDSLVHRLQLITDIKSQLVDPEKITRLEDILVETKKMGDEATPLDVSLDKILYHYIVGTIVTLVTSILARK